jgi:hypothetical protein
MAVSMPKKRYVFVVMLLIDFDDYDTGAACSSIAA